MAANTKIQWAHHTFNPWAGCTKVSAGCANCYAESHYSVKMRGIGWGPNAPRVIKKEWSEPRWWNSLAEEDGRRHRVFCASMADVFEGADTMPAESLPLVRAARVRLFDLIRTTPNLDWLLLTKRPHNWSKVIEESLIIAEGGDADDEDYFVWHGESDPQTDLGAWLNNWIADDPTPENVWLGTSVEDRDSLHRIDALHRCEAAVRFVSFEPLLEELGDITPWLSKLGWAIVGGESGAKARPCNVGWIGSIVGQCKAAEVPVFVKQFGSRPVADDETTAAMVRSSPTGWQCTGDGHGNYHWHLKHHKGGDPAEWPAELRVREMPLRHAKAVR